MTKAFVVLVVAVTSVLDGTAQEIAMEPAVIGQEWHNVNPTESSEETYHPHSEITSIEETDQLDSSYESVPEIAVTQKKTSKKEKKEKMAKKARNFARLVHEYVQYFEEKSKEYVEEPEKLKKLLKYEDEIEIDSFLGIIEEIESDDDLAPFLQIDPIESPKKMLEKAIKGVEELDSSFPKEKLSNFRIVEEILQEMMELGRELGKRIKPYFVKKDFASMLKPFAGAHGFDEMIEKMNKRMQSVDGEENIEAMMVKLGFADY